MSEQKAKQTAGGFSRFFKLVVGGFMRSDLGVSSSAIAYYLLFSIFPLIITVGNLLPYTRLDSVTVLHYIEQLIPSNIYQMVEGTIENLLNTSYGGLLSLSAVTTLWAASLSINALQKSLNKVYGVGKNRNVLIARVLSFLIIFAFMLLIIALTTVFTFGQAFIEKISPKMPLVADAYNEIVSLKVPTTMGGILITMLLIYYVLPNAKTRIRYILVGTLFSTAGWLLLTQIFGKYVKFFATRFSSYGIIGSLIIVLLWLNFAAVVIIIGGILNAATQEYFEGDIKEKAITLSRIRKKYIAITEKNAKD